MPPGNIARKARPARVAWVCVAALALAAPGAAGTLRAVRAGHAEAARAAETASRIEVTDETGRTVEVPQPVRRIVSLAPNLTETLFALGAGDRVVGDTDFCDYPPAAKTKPHVGGPLDPNIEEVAALHPDLVLATRAINRQDTVQALERLGFAVYATDPRSVEQMLDSTARLAQLIGAGETGGTLVAGLRSRLDKLRDRLAGSKPKSVLFVVWESPLITVGRETFLADALRRAGARSVIRSSQDWPNVSLEEVVRQQPEYLIFARDESGEVGRQIAELRDLPGWRDLQAVRRGHIITLSEAIDRPSPRLVGAIEQLARALHPERFTDGPGASGRKRIW
jgi:ABC-type Fe3+-hydroxamate transport system substrate-binding protein